MRADHRRRRPQDDDRLYSSMYDFVLRYGKPFPPAPLPEGITPGALKECFKNATQLAWDELDRFPYVEGYALNDRDSVHLHAWVTDRYGRAIDPTWPDGRAYFGVPFTHEYLDRVVFGAQKYGLIDRWEEQFPLLSGEDSVSEAVLDLSSWLDSSSS